MIRVYEILGEADAREQKSSSQSGAQVVVTVEVGYEMTLAT